MKRPKMPNCVAIAQNLTRTNGKIQGVPFHLTVLENAKTYGRFTTKPENTKESLAKGFNVRSLGRRVQLQSAIANNRI
jgi:hypothetical protein